MASGSTRQPCRSATSARDSNESVQHGRRHERAAARQLPHHVDRFVGQRAGHRLGQLANLGRRKRRPIASGPACPSGAADGPGGSSSERADTTSSTCRRSRASSLRRLSQRSSSLTVNSSLHWQSSRMIAAGRDCGAQRVQEMGQRLHAAVLAELLRHVRIGRMSSPAPGRGGAGRQSRRPDRRRAAPGSVSLKARLRTGFPQELLDHSVEQLERTLPHLATKPCRAAPTSLVARRGARFR